MKYLFITVFTILGLMAHSQCIDFQKNNCSAATNWDYEFDSQSLSVPLFSGQAFRFKAVFYKGKDYYIGFCREDGMANIKFRFLSEDVVIDDSYSQKVNDNLEFIEFSNNTTRIAIIEVKVNKTGKVDINDRKCLGIIIGNKVTEK